MPRTRGPAGSIGAGTQNEGYPPSSLRGILEKPEGVYDPLPGALQISSPQRRPPSFVSPARRASEPIVPPAARR
jgi:hypothetical protein